MNVTWPLSCNTKRDPMHPLNGSVLKKVALFSLLAMLPAAILVMALKTDRLSGDGPSYVDIAQAVASGKGFQEPHGLWKGEAPTMRRPPVWPLVLSVPLRLWSTQDPLSIMYPTEIVLHALTVFGAGLLAWMLSGAWRRVVLAILLVALWPGATAYLVAGLGEPCSTAALTLGTVLVCLGGRYFFGGVFLLSLVPLTRPNFMILPLCAAMVLVVMRAWRGVDLTAFGSRRRLIGAAALFFVPLSAWLIRNYTVTGAFPVVLTKTGEDLYGTYNILTAKVGGPHFGRWIPPDTIPGEENIGLMAARMPELELSRYYQAKGLRFIAGHWRTIPVLMAGRVLYAASPQWPPFGATPTGDRYSGVFRVLEWICRAALYITAIVLLWRGSLRLNPWYGLLLASVAMTTLTTVVFYFGWERFLYQLTVLLIPLVCSARPRAAGKDLSFD
jgi:hypothetical protein